MATSGTGGKTETPVAQMPLNPIFASYARFFIGMINSFKPVVGVKNVFCHPHGIQIRRVEVFAFVTEKIDKYDCVKLTLNDGTGSILCIINKQGKTSPWSKPGPSINMVTTELLQQQRKTNEFLFRSKLFANLDKTIELGDFVVVQARMITSRWCRTPQLVAMKLQVVEEPVVKKWLIWTEKTTFFNENFYAKPPVWAMRKKVSTC